MSFQAKYFFWKLLALIAGVGGFYCLGQVSQWAVYGAFALMLFKILDGVGEMCWREHLERLRAARRGL